jgi:uncharacterized protein (TIGR04255 family)
LIVIGNISSMPKRPVPKKINPDNIINAVVEVKYSSNYPFELQAGLLFPVFDETYTYTSRLLKSPHPYLSMISPPFLEAPLNLNGVSLFYNDKISVRIAPNSFVISCLDKYIGWHEFGPQIEKVIATITKAGYITKWNRVGLRYITEYVNTDLKECTHFSFRFGIPESTSSLTGFHTEFEYQGIKVIINLSNQIPVPRQPSPGAVPEIIPTSLIDVDAIKESLDITEQKALLEEIEKVHDMEKEVFFSLLTEEFIETLNPEY